MGSLLICLGCLISAQAPEPEGDKIVGTWRHDRQGIVRGVEAAKKFEEDVKNKTFVIDDRGEIRGYGGDILIEKGTLKIDEKSNPRRFESEHLLMKGNEDGKLKSMKLHGILKIEDGKLYMRYVRPGDPYPTNFEMKENDKGILHIYRRVTKP
jgi:uncharacterized protein (TIGR03067 family)